MFKLGCIKDSFDSRDYIYEDIVSNMFKRNKIVNLIVSILLKRNKVIDLRDENMPDIIEQDKGSCAFHSCGSSYEYQMNNLIDELELDIPKRNNYFSRLFNYYLSRKMTNSINEDTGSSIRDASKTYFKYGTIEKEKYYEDKKECYALSPTFESLFHADNNKINGYYRVNTKQGILDCLHRKIPIIIGTNIDCFKDCDDKGLSRKLLKLTSKKKINHGMLIVGYIPKMNYYGRKLDCYIIRNSWSKKWGHNGYCYLPVDIMWEYNIGDSWVIIKDELTEEIDKETIKENLISKWFKKIFRR